MRTFVTPIVTREYVIAFCLAVVATTSQAQEWQSLFNGKDLAGWRANNNPESFAVVDGALCTHTLSNTKAHLFYVGDLTEGFVKFKNFELEATARAEPNSNGGIFVHCDMSTRDAVMHLAKGYEVQLNSSAREARKTGSLYAVVDSHESPVDETNWFQVRIVVQDKRITVALNGKQVVDYTEPPNVQRPPERAGRLFSADGGAIALQAHDADSTWYFREIRVRRLP